MRLKMEVRVAARKSSKKEKKVKAKEEEEASTSTTVKVEKDAEDKPGPSSSSTVPSTSKAPNLAEKTLKRSKLDKLGAPEFKKAKEDYSVAEDPKASEVYKSLFTTHETEQNQGRAHWVTYNPHYN